MDLFDIIETIAIELMDNCIGFLPDIREVYIKNKKMKRQIINEDEIKNMILW